MLFRSLNNYKSTYHPVSISTIVDTQKHLSVEDREILSAMLSTHAILFDGILKVYPHQLVHLDTIPNVTPCHLHAYHVAHIHLDVFKAELLRLCDIGILEKMRRITLGISNIYHP